MVRREFDGDSPIFVPFMNSTNREEAEQCKEMANGSLVKHFLNQQQRALKRVVHVRRLLLSEHLRGVLNAEERSAIEKERTESLKCDLFVTAVLSKDDEVAKKFLSALYEKQPELEVLQEWTRLCAQGMDRPTEYEKPTREPDENVDISMVQEKMICTGGSDVEDFNSCKNNDFNYEPATPSPLVANRLDSKNIVGEDTIATKVIYHLSHHVELSLRDKSVFVQEIEQALSENDLMKDTNQKLVDILVRLVREQRLSPLVIEQALIDMNLGNVAKDLITQTVHDKYLDDLPSEAWTRLTQELSVKNCGVQGNTCGRLVEALGLKDKVNISFVCQQYECPAHEVLSIWKQKRCATVSNLYRILLNMEANTAAAILEPFLPVVMEMPQGKVMDRSLSTCSSISDNEMVDTKSLVL